MKKLNLSIVLASLLSIGVVNLNGAIYSTLKDKGSITAIDLITGIKKVIPARDLGLSSEDDIDALSLGDDTRVFNKTRFDIFAVNKGAKGSDGDLKKRASFGLNVSGDVYIETRVTHNKLFYRDLEKNNSIDGFDLGDIVDFEHNELIKRPIFFSLTPSSPTLRKLGATAGDILMVYPKDPMSLKIFVKAPKIGNPKDINALSMNITNPPSGYDSINDYIIYSTKGNFDIYHYGFSEPIGNKPHTPMEFGMDTNDTIEALEHKQVICYDYCIHIIKGWQLFGTKYDIENVKEFFRDYGDTVNAIWGYNEENSKWKFYSPNPNLTIKANASLDIEPLKFLRENEGFWLQGLKDNEICFPIKGDEEKPVHLE